MKVINYAEFESGSVSIFKARIGVAARINASLAKLRGKFGRRYEVDELSARLLREAGIDELEIERRRLANAPMIR